MIKLPHVNTNNLLQKSKKVIKPAVVGTVLCSNILSGSTSKDSFIKESDANISEILKKREFDGEQIKKIIDYRNKGEKEKQIMDSLLTLKKTTKESLPIFSFIKIKKEKPIVSNDELFYILYGLSFKSSDIDFAQKLINLKKLTKNGEKVSVWENGTQLYNFIKGSQNPVVKELIQKNLQTNPINILELEIYCNPNVTTDSIKKDSYLKNFNLKEAEKYRRGILYNQSKTSPQEFLKKLQIIHNLTTSFENSAYIDSANNSFTSQEWLEIARTCSKNNDSKSILENLIKLKNRDIDLWKTLYKNPLLKDVKVYHIANNITDNNRDFILNLCSQEDFPKDIIAGIAYRSAYTYIGIIRSLCEEKNINKKNILVYYDQLEALPRIDFETLEIPLAEKFLRMLNSYDENIKNFAKNFNVDINLMITKINNIIGSKKPSIEIDESQQAEFFKNIIANNSDNDLILKTFDFSQFGKDGLPLKYPRADFCLKINSLLKNISLKEQGILCSHFGLKKGELGGFNGLFNNKSIPESNLSKEAMEIGEEIRKEINKFTTENEVLVNDIRVKKILDSLIKGLPEFTTLIGKKQHTTHNYSIDIHSLLALQKAMNNPLYETLNDADKTVLKISTLLHDIGKDEGIVDENHAHKSSEYTRSILVKIKLSSDIAHRIITTIDSHHWFEKFCNNQATEVAANDVLVHAHSPNDIKIFEILAKADFQSVSPDFHLKRSRTTNNTEFDKYIEDKMNTLDKFATKKLFNKSNFIKTTKFSTKLFPEETIILDEKKETFKVLNLNKISSKKDLKEYGLGCSKKEDIRLFVHMLSCDENSLKSLITLAQNPLKHNLLSVSFIKPSHCITYGDYIYGGIMETDNSNILTAYDTNISSGTKKGEYDYKNIISEDQSEYKINLKYRNFLKNALIDRLEEQNIFLGEQDYSILSKHILSASNLNTLKDITIDKITIKAETIIECIEKAQEKLFREDFQNEVVGIDFKLKALIAKVEKLEDCDKEFLRFARDNKLGIILI